MTKNEFLIKLMKGLSRLPQPEIEERAAFYNEMIDDRMEEGLTEEEAVAAIGSVDDILDQILAETPMITLIKEKLKSKRKLQVWEIVLLSVGSPIWISFIAVIFAVAISLYASLWAVTISLWSFPIAFIAGSLICVAEFIICLFVGKAATAWMALGIGFVCVGFGILFLYACKYITKFAILLTKKLTLFIKKCFTKKEENINA